MAERSPPPPATEEALRALEAEGLIERDGSGHRTTRKWQGAMARAALHLYSKGDPGNDLRVPIALALYGIYAERIADDTLADYVLAMLPFEARALGISAGE